MTTVIIYTVIGASWLYAAYHFGFQRGCRARDKEFAEYWDIAKDAIDEAAMITSTKRSMRNELFEAEKREQA